MQWCQRKLQIKIFILLHGLNKNIISWSQNHLLMLKVYSAQERVAAMGMQERSKSNSVILLHHMLAVYHSLRIIHDMEIGAVLIDWLKMQYLVKMLKKLALDVIWWKCSRRLYPSEVKHCQKKGLIFICWWLLFHGSPGKNSDQLASLLGAIVKKCIYPIFYDKSQV